MPPISATLITLNEARNIARAIRSLSGADEIVVVDAGSTDETREVASSLGPDPRDRDAFRAADTAAKSRALPTFPHAAAR